MLLTAAVAGLALYALYRLFGNGCATRLVLGLMALILLLYVLGGTLPDDGGGPRERVLLALGDSFSSGEGAGPPWEETDQGRIHPCRRSPMAYATLVDPDSDWAEATGRDLDRDVIHVACQGAVADEVRDQYALLPAADRRRTDLVVLTIGGNDVGFSRILRGCIDPTDDVDCLRTYRPAGRDLLGYVIAAATGQVEAQLRTIGNDFPRVLLLGYPPIFALDRAPIRCDFALPSDLDYLTGEEVDYLASSAAALNRSLARMVDRLPDRLGVEFVPVAEAFVGHELCRTNGTGPGAQQVSNRDAWLNDIRFRFRGGPIDPRSFHPTAEGYEAMAICLHDHVELGRNDC